MGTSISFKPKYFFFEINQHNLSLIFRRWLIVSFIALTCQDLLFLVLPVVDLNTIQLSAWRTYLGECRRFADWTVFIILTLLVYLLSRINYLVVPVNLCSICFTTKQSHCFFIVEDCWLLIDSSFQKVHLLGSAFPWFAGCWLKYDSTVCLENFSWGVQEVCSFNCIHNPHSVGSTLIGHFYSFQSRTS